MRHKVLILWFPPILLMALTVLSCSTSDVAWDGQQRIASYGGQIPVSTRSDTSMISIGDSIAMSVWDAPQFNTHSAVRLGGTISIPLVGEIKVAGYSKEELVRILRRKLSEYLKGDVLFSVEVMKPPPKISVFGMVGRQGSFPIDNDLLLVEALILAGGWSETADLRYIKITHQSTLGEERGSVEFDLNPFLETGDTRGMPIVRPGDIVIVPKKENYILEFSSFVSGILFLFATFNVLR